MRPVAHTGIDTGDILGVFPMGRADANSIQELRIKYESSLADGLVELAIRWLNGDLRATRQSADDGRQHFMIHPTLLEIARQKYIDQCDSE